MANNLQRKLRNALNKSESVIDWFTTTGVRKKGIPDMVVIKYDEIIFLEIKTRSDRMSKIQKLKQKKYLGAMHNFVIVTEDNVEDVIKKVINRGIYYATQ